MLNNGLACVEYAAAVIGSYQAVPGFVDVQTCCVGARNVESRLRQHQLKVSLVRPHERDETIMFGLLEHGQKPHDDVLNNGLACVECVATVIGSYQEFLALWMLRSAV